MNLPKLSSELRRFIHSIASVPHLEAMLLLHQAPDQQWDLDTIAQRLYLSSDRVSIVMNELSASGTCKSVTENKVEFIYAPNTPELADLIDQLALFYANNLIEVTNMIHSKANAGRMVHLFADAFRFNKD